MMNLHRNLLLGSMIALALAAAGCDNPADNAGSRSGRAADAGSAPPVIAPGAAASRTASAIDDTALTAKVKAALITEPGLKAMPIDVSTKDAVVTLSGTVASAEERAKAVQLAENVNGVRSVVDNLTLRS
jgi:hyperosmotically inducible protein